MLKTTPQRKRIKNTSKISSFLNSCRPELVPLPNTVTTEMYSDFNNYEFSDVTRGTEVDWLSLKEELAGVGGPDDQLIAGEGEEVLQHSGLCSWVGDGKYYVVTANRKCTVITHGHQSYLEPTGLNTISSPCPSWSWVTVQLTSTVSWSRTATWQVKEPGLGGWQLTGIGTQTNDSAIWKFSCTSLMNKDSPE